MDIEANDTTKKRITFACNKRVERKVPKVSYPILSLLILIYYFQSICDVNSHQYALKKDIVIFTFVTAISALQIVLLLSKGVFCNKRCTVRYSKVSYLSIAINLAVLIVLLYRW